jgi:hypothetical protein
MPRQNGAGPASDRPESEPLGVKHDKLTPANSSKSKPNSAARGDARGTIEGLAEPVIVARFWRNRKGEAVVVQLRQFEGRAIADARVYFTTKDGKLQPTKKGLCVVVARLPDLPAALNKALARATDLGLLGTRGGQ